MSYQYMSMPINIQALPDTAPLNFCEEVSRIFLSSFDYTTRQNKGQFFTSLDLAKLVASRIVVEDSKTFLNIIDLGAGTGMLSCASIEWLISNSSCKELHLDVIENDERVIPYLSLVLEYCALWCRSQGVSLTFRIINVDLIASFPFDDLFSEIFPKSYNIIISNPPYFKIREFHHVNERFRSLSNGQMNAYILFIYSAMYLINEESIIIIMSPQSYFNGKSFEKFRDSILNNMAISEIITFNSRKHEFLTDDVLQKIVITKFVLNNSSGLVSVGHDQNGEIYFENFEYRIIIRDGRIYTPPLDKALRAACDRVGEYRNFLNDFGLDISTGSIVPHETPHLLSTDKSSFPLIWMKNIEDGYVVWPNETYRKPQFTNLETPKSKIMTNSDYILIRRCAFSETKRHLYCSYFSGIPSYVGFCVENHVNYIYSTHKDRDSEETKTLLLYLTYYLQSSDVAAYLKSVCGNTQVNVSDLRNLPIPDIEYLQSQYTYGDI